MNGSESDTKRSNNPLDVDLWKTLWLFVKSQVRILTGVAIFSKKKPQPPLVHPHSPIHYKNLEIPRTIWKSMKSEPDLLEPRGSV